MNKHTCIRCHKTSGSGIWTKITIPKDKYADNIETEICFHCRFELCKFIYGEK